MKVLTAVLLKIKVFWDLTPLLLVKKLPTFQESSSYHPSGAAVPEEER